MDAFKPNSNGVQHCIDFYASTSLQYWAKQYLKKLPKSTNLLISSGSSSASIAAAMMTLSTRKLTHINVGKKREYRHNGEYSGCVVNFSNNGELVTWIPQDNRKVAVVDDFIANGETLLRIYNFCTEHNLKISKVLVSYSSNYNAVELLKKVPELKGILDKRIVWMISDRKWLTTKK